MRILLVTDAWAPQVNGVVRTWQRVTAEAGAMGHEVRVVAPDGFRTVPCPTYPEIRLAVFPGRGVRRAFDDFAPDAIHIATEGPLGLAARRLCLKRGLPFTTSYHTKFPEYVSARAPVPVSWGQAAMRWFHAPSAAVLAATPTVRRELAAMGLKNAAAWTRGVDTGLYRPGLDPALDLPGPVFLYVGRVAVEKNIEAFLRLDLPGSKLIVGDGPARARLERTYPGVHFAGMQFGEALARHYAAGDVFVFPSRTDTFGLVMLEAMACGLPVAAYPVAGPLDVVGTSGAGVLDEDLRMAALGALSIPGARARAHAETFSWEACARQWLAALAPVPGAVHGRAAAAEGLA